MPAETPKPPLADRARAVLQTHCAECRDTATTDGVLDLDLLAANPRLVSPRRPDASRAYWRLLRDQGDAATATLTSEDIEAVRDWIENLPARAAACGDRTTVSHQDARRAMTRWGQAAGQTEASDTRFVSLVHLWNVCLSAEDIKVARDTVVALLSSLAARQEPVAVETVGEQSAILAVRLRDLSLTPEQWTRLTEQRPLAPVTEPVAADWLARRLLSQPKDSSGTSDADFKVALDPAMKSRVERLALHWDTDLDLVRAAGERGVPPEDLARALAAVGGEFLRPSRRLLNGSITRSAWTQLARALNGEAKPGTAIDAETVPENEIDVVVWADKASYRASDLLTINVSVSKACNLTLIDVDRDGKAIVLFPNDLDEDNLIAPGVTVRIPSDKSGYQFRLDRAGEEEIVGICKRGASRPDGISYDYEKQRFAMLGDWRTFLRSVPVREKEIHEAAASEAARRRRRGRQPTPEAAPVAANEVAAEGRTAIYIDVKPTENSPAKP